MTILVIGNGFDKALGLPTDYADFLKFARFIKEFMSDENQAVKPKPEDFGIDDRIVDQIHKNCGNVRNNLFSKRIDIEPISRENFWLEYFFMRQESLVKQGKDKWVDFETEITKQVVLLEKAVNKAPKGIDDKYENNLDDIEMFCINNSIEFTTYREVHDRLLGDLDNLTWLMGMYYAEYVEKINVFDLPDEIKSILNDINENDEFKVISFNYTHFLERYLKDSGINCAIDYVHGEAEISKSVATNNMVLGAAAGEDNLDFADFKKYFQRILKKTDHNYIDWIEKMSNNDNLINHNGVNQELKPKNRVIFFGHSMDLTDEDIIKKFVMAPNTWTTIYCYKKNEQDHRDIAQKIKNIQSIITRDELIKRTSVGGVLSFV